MDNSSHKKVKKYIHFKRSHQTLFAIHSPITLNLSDYPSWTSFTQPLFSKNYHCSKQGYKDDRREGEAHYTK